MRLHRDVAFRVAWSIAPAQAEEALQEACIKAFRSIETFAPGARWRPWFLTIVANEAKNQVRSTSRHRARVERAWDPTVAVPVPSAEDHVVDAEARMAVAEALGRLAEPHRAVIVCRIFLELSVAETAAVLDVPAGTVKSRLARALRNLEEAL